VGEAGGAHPEGRGEERGEDTSMLHPVKFAVG
jgi:hypothetical protein